MGENWAHVSLSVCVMFILCSLQNVLLYDTYQEQELVHSTGARDAVHEGAWASYKQMPVGSYCYSGFAYDMENDYIAIPDCDSYNYETLHISIRHNSDWNTVVQLIETNLLNVQFLSFSPNGEYLLVLDYEFEIYKTDTWERVYSDDISSTDGSYYPAQDISWSGDGERLVIATGYEGGKMYEGPDWQEVTGTTSNGYYVTHHPLEDTLWYLSTDGTVAKFELQNVPFVGESWVQVQTYTTENTEYGRMSISPSGNLILVNVGWYGNRVYTSSSFELEFTAYGTSPVFSSSGSHLLYQTYNSGYEIYSTDVWSRTSQIDEETSSNYYAALSFSSDNDEIISLVDGGRYGEIAFMAMKPDSDYDGVVDELDSCPSTPTEEGADVRGCAPSQRDTDLDGINDRDDVCPRTNVSSSVDASGCSEEQLSDSDGDGISDSDDQCPNTPINEYSNIYGCSSSQRDVDEDGLSDLNDPCPLDVFSECSDVRSWIPDMDPIDGTEDYPVPLWSPSGDLLATFGDSNKIIILNPDLSIEHEITNEIAETSFSRFLWLPDGNSIVALWRNTSYYQSTCGYSIFTLSNVENPTHSTISNTCDAIRARALNPYGDELAVSIFSYDDYSGKLVTINLSSGNQGFEDDNYYPRQLAYSHDGTTLVGFTSGSILMWDTFDGYLLRSEAIDSITSFHQSPDGDWLIITAGEEIKLYSFNTLNMKDSISIEPSYDEDSYVSIDDISISRNGNLIYVSISETHYTQGERTENVTLHTYRISESNEIEFLVKSNAINESSWMSMSISPDESMAFVRLSSVDGLTRWTRDSDADGITDTDDLCQETPVSSEIDVNGCSQEQRDDDNDGVANSDDLCPNSSSGIPADENGCTDQQVDFDLDGVCDEGAVSNGPSNCFGEDKCPDSKPGVQPDANGCTWAQQDSDRDGVNNAEDQCEDTEIAGDADANGCDRKQRDIDGDSVFDYWDLCEQTSSGDEIDEVGCSDAQVDSDFDNVCDRNAASVGPSNCTSTDICPNTEMNQSVDQNGCSWDQRDDDEDGVFNKFDLCPDTLSDTVAPNGCSAWQIDTDSDGVYDANDECANTDPNQIANAKGCSDEQSESKGVSSSENILGSNLLVGLTVLVVIALIVFTIMRSKRDVRFEEAQPVQYPEYATRGAMRDGMEWIEHPAGSQQWFYRDPSTQQWIHRK